MRRNRRFGKKKFAKRVKRRIKKQKRRDKAINSFRTARGGIRV